MRRRQHHLREEALEGESVVVSLTICTANSQPWLAEPELGKVACAELARLDSPPRRIIAYCVMPDHVQLLAATGGAAVGRIVQLFKGRVSRQFDGASWTQLGADIDGEAADDDSGRSVSLSSDGSRVAIGARYNDGAGNDAGHVRIYEFGGGSWTQFGADIDGEAAGDQSGWSVSLSSDGSRVAIGAYLNDGAGIDAGHVRIYEALVPVELLSFVVE